MKSALYLIYGEDEFEVAKKAKQIVQAHIGEQNDEFGVEVIDGQVDTVAQALSAIGDCKQALNTPGFLTSEKAVWLKGADFLHDNVVGRSETVKAAAQGLGDLIKQGFPAGTIFVISAAKIDKRYALFKTCRDVGELSEFSVPTQARGATQHALDRLGDFLQEAGLTMNNPVRTAFLDRVGMDSRMMNNEVDKLNTYLGSRRDVAVEDIEAVTSASHEAIAWDLADAFGKRDLGRALKITRKLLFQKESPIALIAMLESRIRELMVIRESVDKGWLRRQGRKTTWQKIPAGGEEAFTQHFSRDPRSTHPFRTWILSEQAMGFSMAELQRCQGLAISAHRQLVSRSLPDELQLEMFLIRMLN